MFQKRSLTTGFLVASLGLAAGLAIFSSPNVASAGDATSTCTQVKSVCEAHKGDKKKIDQAMKDAVRDFKKANPGDKIKCESCHKKDDNSLTANGKADFETKLAKFYK